MKFVHIVDDVEGIDPEEELPLVVALDGFLDAGHASSLAISHLVDAAPGPVVATFDVDVFHDYRARRPAVTFAVDRYRDLEAPRLILRLQRDAAGRAYLLLTGPEPDSRWEAFTRAVIAVIERFDVSLVVTIDSVPMTTPHTRPLAVTQHANNSSLMRRQNLWTGDLRVPASVHAMLSVRLEEAGIDLTGYVVHVPHYLAQFDHPGAARTLLEGVSDSTDLIFDLSALDVAAARQEEQVTDYLLKNPEVAEVVAGLEQQYDAFREAEEAGSNLLADEQPIPTGDELGAEFERFLAGLDGQDPTP